MAEQLDLEPLDLEPIKDKKLDLDPLDLEQVENEVDPEEQVGQFEAGVRGAGQGLTLGFADEAAAGLQAGLDVATSDKKLSDLKQLYQAYKELQQERERKASEQNPKTYMGAEIAGSLPTALLPGGQVTTAGKAAKLGAIYGLGKSEADLTSGEVGEASKDILLGSILGYGGGKAGELVGKGLSKIGAGSPLRTAGDKISTQAEDVALSTLGTNKKTLENEIGQSIFTPSDYRKGIGREVLENRGILDSPGDLKQKLASQIKEIEGQKGPLLEYSQRNLQDLMNMGGYEGEGLATKLTAIKDKIVDREAKTATNIGSVKQLDDQLTETIKRYASNDSDIVKLNEFKKLLKTKLDDASFNKQTNALPQEEEYLTEAYRAVNKRIQELSDIAEPGTGDILKQMGMRENIKYDAANLARDAQRRELAKEAAWSPWDIVGGLADKAKIGAAKGLGKAGRALTEAGNYIEGPAPSVSILRPVLEDKKERETKPLKLSQNLYNASPEEISNVANILEQNEQFSAYGKSLRDSLQSNNSQKKNAILFSILQNPKIRKLIEPTD